MCNISTTLAMNEGERPEAQTVPKIPGLSQLIMIAETERAKEAFKAQQSADALRQLANATAGNNSSSVLSPIFQQNFLQAPQYNSFVTMGLPAVLPSPMGMATGPGRDYQLQQLISMYCTRPAQQNFVPAELARPIVPEEYSAAMTASKPQPQAEACAAALNVSRTDSSSSSRTTISNQVTPMSPSTRRSSDSSISACDEASSRAKKVRSQTLEASQALEIYAERPSASPKGVSKRRLAGQLAKKYKVAPNTIRDIWNRRSWAKVTIRMHEESPR